MENIGFVFVFLVTYMVTTFPIFSLIWFLMMVLGLIEVPGKWSHFKIFNKYRMWKQ